MTFSIMTLSRTTTGIATIVSIIKIMTLCIIMKYYAECHYIDNHYAECHLCLTSFLEHIVLGAMKLSIMTLSRMTLYAT